MNIVKIDRCPSLLIRGYDTFSPTAQKRLFDGRPVSHKFDLSQLANDNVGNAVKNAGRLSLSGAQPKFGLVIDCDNALRLSKENEQSLFLMKPRPLGYQIINSDFCAANENLTMQIASQIYGIKVADNGLLFSDDGQVAYITRRFDVYKNGKYAQEDFASLLGLTRANGGSDFKYINSSYEECAEVIRRYVKASAIDLLRFFQLILFNFITLNDDAHLKNFTLLSNGKEYRLSPAYDLVNTSLQISNPRIFALDNGLFKEGMNFSDTRTICRADFEEFGRRIGLPQKVVQSEIDRFSAHNNKLEDLISRSFLSEQLKKYYRLSLRYRQVLIQ